jgi:hypothetical protein
MTDWETLETKLNNSIKTIYYFDKEDKFDLTDDVKHTISFLKREYRILSQGVWMDLETMEKRILRIYANEVLTSKTKRELCLQFFDLFMRRMKLWSMNTKYL